MPTQSTQLADLQQPGDKIVQDKRHNAKRGRQPRDRGRLKQPQPVRPKTRRGEQEAEG